MNAKMIKNLKPKTKKIGKMTVTKQEFFKMFIGKHPMKVIKYAWENNTTPGKLKGAYGLVRKMWIKTLSDEEKVCVGCNIKLQTNDNEAKDYLTCDHIMPKSKYPHLMLAASNFQAMCRNCNNGKGNK